MIGCRTDAFCPFPQVKWSEDGQSLYLGGLDNDIHVFSLTSHAISYSLRAHSDTISSLALSPSNQHLLSCGMDSTLNLWSVQPFAPTVNTQNPNQHPRLVRSFYGAPAGFEQLLRKASWSRHQGVDGQPGSYVAVGGADRALTVWDARTGEIKYKVRLFLLLPLLSLSRQSTVLLYSTLPPVLTPPCLCSSLVTLVRSLPPTGRQKNPFLHRAESTQPFTWEASPHFPLCSPPCALLTLPPSFFLVQRSKRSLLLYFLSSSREKGDVAQKTPLEVRTVVRALSPVPVLSLERERARKKRERT